ncbi:MAG: acylglycerol kinase family protein [Chloroflexi bacterium]|nr:acylglycerol kinase family protein [Chloroflexota bacterium]
MPRAVVLLNPRSRSGGSVPVRRLLEPFRESGWSAELWAGDGIDWTYPAAVRARTMGVDAIFGAGGDGVLAQILPAVLDTEVALGVVPLGTGNVWARELRLPLNPRAAIVAQLGASPLRVDVGMAKAER